MIRHHALALALTATFLTLLALAATHPLTSALAHVGGGVR